MGTSAGFSWGKIGTLCSLKAIALACFLTPATVVLPTTPALAQFGIVFPGFGGFRVHGRRYGRHSSRHSRYSRYSRYRGRPGGEQPGEVSPPPGSTNGPSAAAPAVPPSPAAPAGTSKFRGTTD